MGAEDLKDLPKDSDPGEETPPAGTGTDAAAADDDPKDDDPDDGIKDKHGQPGINKERHEKLMAAKDAKIAELEAKVAEAAETKEGRERLQKEIADLKAEQADERMTHKLELAGCRSIKAAKALLDDFDGDVPKLKAEHPYLFEKDKQTGRAGGKPGGAPDGMSAKIDAAMGVKD